MSNTVEMSITPRHCIGAGEDKVFISLDFKNQEMYGAGVSSGDKIIVNALLNEPEFKTRIDDKGKEVQYKNHLADLHTITCMNCCFPELFVDKPEWEYVNIAKDGSLIAQKGDPRLYAKIVNFGIIYGQTHISMAKNNFVKEEVAKVWIKEHKNTYWQFHDWADEQMHMAKMRGWAMNSYSGRIRMVNEDNAKGAGASPARSGVNFKIQGLCADIGKLSLIRVDDLCDVTEGMDIRAFVHDELCVTAFGKCELDEVKTAKVSEKKGVWSPVYTWDEEAEHNARLLCEQMELAQSEVLGEGYKGLVDYSIAPYWEH